MNPTTPNRQPLHKQLSWCMCVQLFYFCIFHTFIFFLKMSTACVTKCGKHFIQQGIATSPSGVAGCNQILNDSTVICTVVTWYYALPLLCNSISYLQSYIQHKVSNYAIRSFLEHKAQDYKHWIHWRFSQFYSFWVQDMALKKNIKMKLYRNQSAESRVFHEKQRTRTVWDKKSTLYVILRNTAYM